MFEHVYLVSTRLKLVDLAEAEEVVARRSCALPHGYREYLTELGRGELSQLLRVRNPGEVIASRDEDFEFLSGNAESLQACLYRSSVLPPSKLRTAVVFATTVDGDMLIGCREHPGRLFCVPRHGDEITEIPDGFLGAVEQCKKRCNDQFAYFEPYAWSQRRACGFTMKSPGGIHPFIKIVAAHWGERNVVASNAQTAEYSLEVFVRQIQAHITLFLDNSRQSSPDQNAVVLRYDIEFDRDVAEFVEAHRAPYTEVWTNPKLM